MKEFLPTLTTRTKWHCSEKRPVQIGDLVWVIDPAAPRATFPLGRILELHTGDDGETRSAKVRTKMGTYVRPLVKLIPLQVEPHCVPNKSGNRAGDVADKGNVKTF